MLMGTAASEPALSAVIDTKMEVAKAFMAAAAARKTKEYVNVGKEWKKRQDEITSRLHDVNSSRCTEPAERREDDGIVAREEEAKKK